MSAPNLLVSSGLSCTAKTSFYTCTGSVVSTTLTVPANTVWKLNGVFACNVTTATATVTVSVYRSSTNNYLVYALPIPPGASISIIGRADGGINLEEGDVLYAGSGTNTAILLSFIYDAFLYTAP